MSTANCATISIGEFKQKLFSSESMNILDVREIEEYREGHVEGSVLIPLGILTYRADELEPDKETIVVCRSGNRSMEACKILKERGFRRVYSLDGGLISWTY